MARVAGLWIFLDFGTVDLGSPTCIESDRFGAVDYIFLSRRSLLTYVIQITHVTVRDCFCLFVHLLHLLLLSSLFAMILY